MAAAATSRNGASSSANSIPENLLSITVTDVRSSLDGTDYQVKLKTCLPCFRVTESMVRRTQREFEWLCKQCQMKSFAVPFGESADTEGDMRRLQGLLIALASDPVLQYDPALRCFFASPIPIELHLTSDKLQAEEALLKDCTDDKLDDMSMEELRGLCLRHGLSTIADFDDREYFVEKILMQSDRQLKSDLDVLENAMKSLQGGWDDVNPSITEQPAANISLPEIEEALASLENFATDAEALQAFEDPLPPADDEGSGKPTLHPDLPAELLQALENPYAAAMEELTANVGNGNL